MVRLPSGLRWKWTILSGDPQNTAVKPLAYLYSWQTWNAWFLQELAVAPGLNSVFSAVKRKARGFRSVKNLITMLYFTAGKLPLPATP